MKISCHKYKTHTYTEWRDCERLPVGFHFPFFIFMFFFCNFRTFFSWLEGCFGWVYCFLRIPRSYQIAFAGAFFSSTRSTQSQASSCKFHLAASYQIVKLNKNVTQSWPRWGFSFLAYLNLNYAELRVFFVLSLGLFLYLCT